MTEKELSEQFVIRDEFAPATYDRWRSMVEADLKGASFEQKLVTHTYEGIDLQPVYARPTAIDDTSGFPGLPPFVRGTRPLGAAGVHWDLRQEQLHPDLQLANQAILDDLHGGVTSLLLKFDDASRRGFDADDPSTAELAGRGGMAIYGLEDLAAVLTDVDLRTVPVSLDAGAAFLPFAATLVALWNRRGVDAESAIGAFGADPLAEYARSGQLPQKPESALALLADLAAWTAKSFPNVTAVTVDSSSYHHAGATAAQDIGFALATAVEYLRAMIDAGMDIDSAARQILFRMSVGTHHFLSIAKLRAARRLWWRVVQASGGAAPSGRMRIHARTSQRVLTQRDPHVNLLRNAVGVFAAGIGGAEIITSVPFDSMTGLPDRLSRRIARNTALIAQEESHLHAVVDPAGGSWFVESVTDDIADEAWAFFQSIEQRGGMLKALQSGWACEKIDSAYAPRAKDIARRKEGITGVSEFPDIHEERVVHPPPDLPAIRMAAAKRVAAGRIEKCELRGEEIAASSVEAAIAGATIGQIASALGFRKQPADSITPLELRSFAEPFEELRDAADAWAAQHGTRPSVFLANIGSVAHHTARASYAKNFFEAGGFEVIGNDGFKDADSVVAAFVESRSHVAVICSSDTLYQEFVPQVAPKLKAAGARSVVVAGFPADNETAWRDAGVDRFIFISCDVLVTLRELLREEGVLQS